MTRTLLTLPADALVGTPWDNLIRQTAQWRSLRLWQDENGMRHVFTAPDVRAVLSDHANFSSNRSRHMPPSPQLGPGNLTMMDPPRQSEIRKIIATAFSPATTATYEDDVREILAELTSKIDPSAFNVIDDLAYELPVRVICRILNIPRIEMSQFRYWSRGFSMGDPGCLHDFHNFAKTQLRAAAETPQKTPLLRIVEARERGTLRSDDEAAALLGLLLLAGHVTTTSLIAAATLECATQPGLAVAVTESARYHDLIDESLRTRPPFAQVTRIVENDTYVGDTLLETGTHVSAWILSANYDPNLNEDADHFLLDRPDRRTLSFGHGAHYCLGSHLARLEATLALHAILECIPTPTLATPPQFHPLPTLSVKRLVIRNGTR